MQRGTPMQSPTRKAEPAAVDASEAAKSAGEVAIDVRSGGSLGEDGGSETVKVCRICHLTSGGDDDDEDGDEEAAAAAGELIQIGCACKGELGSAHRQCAEAWFRAKGDRYCEICGANAKNINGEDDDGGFMEEWHAGGTMARTRTGSSERAGCLRDQPLCNLFVASLVIAFIVLCFFRVNFL